MGRKKSYNFSHTYFVSSECKCSKWQARNLEDSSLTVPLQIWYNYHHLTWNSCIWVITRSRNPWARGNFGRCPYFSWFFFFFDTEISENWWFEIENEKLLRELKSYVRFSLYSLNRYTFQNTIIYHSCFWFYITFIYILSFEKYLQSICL